MDGCEEHGVMMGLGHAAWTGPALTGTSAEGPSRVVVPGC